MTQYTIGIRDLKAHLSSYLEKVQKGHTIIITSHGKPIAQLNPTREELMDRVKIMQDRIIILPVPSDINCSVRADPTHHRVP